jgi:nuclear transport factor 2 (NTF2) superfamily protein
MDKAEREALIEKYGRAYADFEAAVDELPKEIWQFKPEPTEWSVHEIIVHMADSEANSALRARRLVAEPGRDVMAYDQDVWAERLDYHSQSWEAALELLKWVRKTTYDLIKNLPDDVWDNTAVHAEYEEPYTFEQWLRIYAEHPYVHIKQMQKNYELWKTQNG